MRNHKIFKAPWQKLGSIAPESIIGTPPPIAKAPSEEEDKPSARTAAALRVAESETTISCSKKNDLLSVVVFYVIESGNLCVYGSCLFYAAMKWRSSDSYLK
ncbi:hypothetical protein CDAR_379361 [Caerostris darwini]|uniref:Uncharacterized protein n=1 Tax=Caerostris darwini TaxID=1538125 RepID=A0AAV4VAF6_9ARAC|nr:hypothetical protein CDAR_379361 [Caerostris darwini]